jgi:hypothetical protein
MHLHDIDAWRAALLMVQHYVSHALQRAVAHVAELQRAGDTVAAALVANAINAITEWSRGRRGSDPLNWLFFASAVLPDR